MNIWFWSSNRRVERKLFLWRSLAAHGASRAKLRYLLDGKVAPGNCNWKATDRARRDGRRLASGNRIWIVVCWFRLNDDDDDDDTDDVRCRYRPTMPLPLMSVSIYVSALLYSLTLSLSLTSRVRLSLSVGYCEKAKVAWILISA